MVQQVCISEYTKAKKLNYLVDDSEAPASQKAIPKNFVGEIVEVSSLPSLISTGEDGNLPNYEWALKSEASLPSYKKYYRLTPKNLTELSILNSEHTYIINYYTGEVYNETKKNTTDGLVLYIKSVDVHQRDDEHDTENYVNW